MGRAFRVMRLQLLLTHHPHYSYANGLWHTDYEDPEQSEALKHFSGGCVAITHDRLDEIIFVADLHDWDVVTTNNATNDK
jgi:hypothetical protein